MTDEDYKQLEVLLTKLTGELNASSIAVVTGCVQDGYSIATYSSNGVLKQSEMSHNIKDTVRKFKRNDD